MSKRKTKKTIEKERLAKIAETIRKRQQKEKNKMLEEFQNSDNISAVCARLKIHRSKFYRWYDEDKDFKKIVDSTRKIGRNFTVDGVEARLVNQAKNGSIPAIKFYLEHNSSRYRKRELRNYHEEIEMSAEKTAEIANAVLNFSGISKTELMKDFEKDYRKKL